MESLWSTLKKAKSTTQHMPKDSKAPEACASVLTAALFTTVRTQNRNQPKCRPSRQEQMCVCVLKYTLQLDENKENGWN